MRRLEYLISEARLNTNTQDQSAITTQTCVNLANRAQSMIEDLIFQANSENPVFRSEYELNLTSGTDTYQLPHDVYNKSSLIAVGFGEPDTFDPIDNIDEKNRGNASGYFTSEDDIIFCPVPTNNDTVLLSYVRKIPTVGVRAATVGVIAGATMNLTALEYTGTQIAEKDEYVTIVDSNGVVIEYGLKISSSAAGSLTLTANVPATVLAGHFIVIGKYATTHSQLPDECEKYFLSLLEKYILYRQSAGADGKATLILDGELKDAVIGMFQHRGSDLKVPPITEWLEWM